ncbi:MAG: hypothetical protein L0Z62_24890 [Gemmataceae bacterium]|nr:hypothetical protein [Gemmataceae bacterium]
MVRNTTKVLLAALAVALGVTAGRADDPTKAPAGAGQKTTEELTARIKQLEALLEAQRKEFAARVEKASQEAQSAADLERLKGLLLQIEREQLQRRAMLLEARIRELEKGAPPKQGAKKGDDPALKALEALRKEVEKLVKDSAERTKKQAQALAEARRQAEKARDEAQLVLKVMQAELARSRAEAEALRVLIKAQEGKVLAREQEVAELKRRAQVAEDTAKTATTRMQALMKQNDVLLQALARLQAGGERPKGDKEATKSNPPPNKVKGKVLKVDPKDKNLVEISLGSDSGLKVGHTLEIYRLQPRAEYLGRLEVIQVAPNSAVARILRQGDKGSAVQPGDEVASSIRP